MRILILSNVPPGLVGGAEVQALNLAHQWAAAGHKVVVAGYANCPHEIDNISIVRLHTLRLNRVLRAVSYLVAVLLLLWRNQNNYDVVYCRFLKEQTFAACLAKIIFRLPQPIVACPACASSEGDVSKILRSTYKRFWIWVFRNGLTAINVMTSEIEQEILGLGVSNVIISQIPNGVVLPEIKPGKAEHDKKVRIVFVGRLVEQKGLDVLLKAVIHLMELFPVFTIDIIGDGPLRPALTTQIHDFELGEVVHLVGALSPDNLSLKLQQAELFVFPSRYEGMSGALLEAIAHGLPAIVTRVSGSEEIIDDSIGWLIPIDDEKALAEAMREALNLGHSGLREMGSRARMKAEVKFDITKIAVQYLELFKRLLE